VRSLARISRCYAATGSEKQEWRVGSDVESGWMRTKKRPSEWGVAKVGRSMLRPYKGKKFG